MAFDYILTAWGGKEITPMQAYTKIFRLGENMIQRAGEEAGSFKANPIAYWKNNSEPKGHYRIMLDDTFEEVLKELQGADFSILNGITYFGRKNTQEHASKMYAMIFDIDGVNDKTLHNFMSGAFKAKAYPVPNILVESGHGMHLYYIFNEPIPLFPYTKRQLKELKYALTKKMWNRYTSTEKKIQLQGINQGFRVIGGKTKPGCEFEYTKAYCIRKEAYTIAELCEYVPEESRVDEKKIFKESKCTLEEAKVRYPEWYERKIINKDKRRKKWNIAEKTNGDNPIAMYDWWIRQIKSGATYGHRYFCIMCLCIYGVKLDVPEKKVRADAMALLPYLNDINPEEPFTKEDIKSALECYDDRYATFPRKDLQSLSGIEIPPNKRNYRKRADHVKLMNAMKQLKKQFGEEVKEGRPTAEEIVKEWQRNNPGKKKVDCIRETGLSKPTVYKWWN